MPQFPHTARARNFTGSSPISGLSPPNRSWMLATAVQPKAPGSGGCDGAWERDLGRIWPRIISSSCSCLCYLQSDAAGLGHGRCHGERLGQLPRPQNSSVPAAIVGRKEKRGKNLINIIGEQPAPSGRRRLGWSVSVSVTPRPNPRKSCLDGKAKLENSDTPTHGVPFPMIS